MNEQELRAYAQKVAANCKKPLDDIIIEVQKEIQVPYQEAVEVKTGFLGLSKKTEYITKYKKQRRYEKEKFDFAGWVLGHFYEYQLVEYNDDHLEQELREDYYPMLEINGSLSIVYLKSTYNNYIVWNHPGHERPEAGANTTETEIRSMKFEVPADIPWVDSAYIFDYACDWSTAQEPFMQRWRATYEARGDWHSDLVGNYPRDGLVKVTKCYDHGEGLLSKLQELERV